MAWTATSKVSGRLSAAHDSTPLDTVTGHFFDREQETRAEAQAYDPTAQHALRELSEKLAGDFLS
jgi:hypothetical protein